jgi:hypothetical protein
MTQNRKISILVSVVFTLIFLTNCTTGTTNTSVTPILATTVLSGVTSNSAVTGGVITSDGGATVTSQGVCWNTIANPTISNNKIMDTSGSNTFISSIAGLSAGTVYYVRAFATNSVGTSYGNELTFTTTIAVNPVLSTLTTTAASLITSTTVAAGGNVTSDGGSTITAKGICWSTTTGPTVALTTKTSDGVGTGIFASSITGLTALTTYYARAYATNSVGTAYGNEISFTTTALPANSAGTLTVTTGTSSAGGGYSPRNVIAIWIRTSSGAFVKSLMVLAATRKYDLSNWASNSGQNTTNATTGATQSSYTTRTCTWNGTNTSGTLVANGDYKVCMELCDGGLSYKEFTFTKGPTAAALTPASAGSFSNISINWTPN